MSKVPKFVKCLNTYENVIMPAICLIIQGCRYHSSIQSWYILDPTLRTVALENLPRDLLSFHQHYAYYNNQCGRVCERDGKRNELLGPESVFNKNYSYYDLRRLPRFSKKTTSCPVEIYLCG